MSFAAVDASFLWSDGLRWLLVVPVVAIALGWREVVLDHQVERAIGPRHRELAPNEHRSRRWLPTALFAAAAALVVIALAQPTWGFERVSRSARSVDLVVALDVSRSMLARDVAPSRLERAKSLLRGVAQRLTADRIGIVVFSGEARLLVPLTQDMESFTELLDQAEPEAVRLGGTDLAAALDRALAALPDDERSADAAPAIVLVTDGEDPTGRGLEAADRCARRGVIVHAIGLGTALGGKIPVPLPGEREGETFLTDREGHDVVSALDPRSLRAIAESTRGTYVDGNADEQALLDLVDRQVLRAARDGSEAGGRPEPRAIYQWPLLIAWLLWIVELGRRPR